MSPPLIALAGMHSRSVRGLRREGVVAARRVVEALRRAGGEPVVLPPLEGPDEADAIATRFDGLVLPGGDDLDPALHGGAAPAGDDVDRVHDDADIALARAALRHGMPLLAICRGMQVLNVALGGTLLEEVPNSPIPHHEGLHSVRLEPDCAVAQVMNTTAPTVSSYHHQAVDRLGQGLRIRGRSPDGCVEVIEHETADVLAVQWHPEDDPEHRPGDRALFDAVVERSATRQRTTTHCRTSIPQAPATKGQAR